MCACAPHETERVLEKRKLKIVVTWFLVAIGKGDSGAVIYMLVCLDMKLWNGGPGRVALNTSWPLKILLSPFTQRNFSACTKPQTNII